MNPDRPGPQARTENLRTPQTFHGHIANPLHFDAGHWHFRIKTDMNGEHVNRDVYVRQELADLYFGKLPVGREVNVTGFQHASKNGKRKTRISVLAQSLEFPIH